MWLLFVKIGFRERLTKILFRLIGENFITILVFFNDGFRAIKIFFLLWLDLGDGVVVRGCELGFESGDPLSQLLIKLAQPTILGLEIVYGLLLVS